MARSKGYLERGVEIRWNCDPALLVEGDKTPAEAVFHFPGGLGDFLREQLGEDRYNDLLDLLDQLNRLPL